MTLDGAQALAARPERPWPRVTVGILAFNRRDAVRTTLREVLALDYPADALEVIVVDNKSWDGTSEMVHSEFPDVRVDRLPENVGVSGVNRALRLGRGEWFLVLDDDAFLQGDALKRAIAAAEAAEADLVSFSVRSAEDPDHLFNDEYVTGLLSFWGAAWAISRRAVARVGGFDPAIFLWGNEAELTARVLDEGLRHLFLPDVVATHLKGPSTMATVTPASHRLNYRHWGYIAGKLLRGADAARVLGRLATTVLLDAAVHDRAAAATLPVLLAGFRDGLRHRRPLRPGLSALYRDAFTSFANPLRWVRGPRERLRGEDGAARRERFYAAHPEVFPSSGPAVLAA